MPPGKASILSISSKSSCNGLFLSLGQGQLLKLFFRPPASTRMVRNRWEGAQDRREQGGERSWVLPLGAKLGREGADPRGRQWGWVH